MLFKKLISLHFLIDVDISRRNQATSVVPEAVLSVQKRVLAVLFLVAHIRLNVNELAHVYDQEASEGACGERITDMEQ